VQTAPFELRSLCLDPSFRDFHGLSIPSTNILENGVISNFDLGIQCRQYKTTFIFRELGFYLKRLRKNSTTNATATADPYGMTKKGQTTATASATAYSYGWHTCGDY
jgi:hypothetical protein